MFPMLFISVLDKTTSQDGLYLFYVTVHGIVLLLSIHERGEQLHRYWICSLYCVLLIMRRRAILIKCVTNHRRIYL